MHGADYITHEFLASELLSTFLIDIANADQIIQPTNVLKDRLSIAFKDESQNNSGLMGKAWQKAQSEVSYRPSLTTAQGFGLARIF